MNFLNIITQATSFLLGSKNLKGKASTIFLGLPVTYGASWLMENSGYIPTGFTSFLENINLSGYNMFYLWAFVLLFVFRQDILAGIKAVVTPNGRRDSRREAMKDELEEILIEVEILEAKKRQAMAKKELEETIEKITSLRN